MGWWLFAAVAGFVGKVVAGVAAKLGADRLKPHADRLIDRAAGRRDERGPGAAPAPAPPEPEPEPDPPPYTKDTLHGLVWRFRLESRRGYYDVYDLTPHCPECDSERLRFGRAPVEGRGVLDVAECEHCGHRVELPGDYEMVFAAAAEEIRIRDRRRRGA